MKREHRSTAYGTFLAMLVLCCTGTTVRSQNVTAAHNVGGLTNSSTIWGLLNTLDIPALIGSMQQDGRLVELASLMASGSGADIQISNECIRDGLIMLRGVLNTNMWAIQMLDAIGKPHSGIISDLDINWLGSFDECLGIEAVTYSNDTLKSEPVHHFDGKYCKIGLPLPAGLTHTIPELGAQQTNIKIGVCIPDTCNTGDLRNFMILVGQSMFNTSAEYKPDAECQDGEPLPTKAIVAM